MKIASYLKRFNIKKVTHPDLSTLEQLQHMHMRHVPFENLDVIHHVSILLNLETYYEKVVNHKRGGFCYELNGLFHWLLESLGYDNQLIAATVHRPDGTWAFSESHATQVVQLDELYLVDVGFGDSSTVPLPLTGEPREDAGGRFRVIQQKEVYEMQKEEEKNQWRTLYHFQLKPKKLTDFKDACHFNQTSPNSTFTQKRIVTIATEKGRTTLSDNSLTITEHHEKHKEPIPEEAVPKVLKKHFGIVI